MMQHKPFPLMSLLVFTLGFTLAFWLESHHLPLLFGLSFTFSNIVLMVMLRRFGPGYALPAAAIVYLASIWLWGSPLPVTIFLLELIVISIALHKFNRQRIVLMDWIFWLVMGAPILLVTFLLFFDLKGYQLWLTVVVYMVNGLLNMTFADLIWAYFPKNLLTSEQVDRRRPLHFYVVLYHIILLSSALPIFILIISVGKAYTRFSTSYMVTTEFMAFVLHRYFYIIFALFVLLIVIALIGHYLNKRLLGAINIVTSLTNDLPSRLHKGITIDWPESRIVEIRALIRNFRSMSNKLVQMFQESVQSEKLLHQLAYYDELTGLPNRLHLMEYVKSLNFEHPDKQSPFAVMFADLNRFKQVNDILGHSIGDQLLRSVADRFAQILSEQCRVFRLSGDEFLFILHYEDIHDVQHTANSICRSLDAPFVIHGRTMYMSVSVGISVYPYDGDQMEDIMRNADIAMYAAKEQGEGFYHFYDSLIENQRALRIQLENDLKTALRQEQFILYYQPKIDAISHDIIGAEALIRWLHPEYGLISPGDFIPLAENSGIILDIDEWAIRQACYQCKQWQEQGILSLPVSINISARHFYQSNLIPLISKILDETKLDPSYIVLEVTESTLIKDVKYGVQIMESLTKMGIRISMDDFGTGYSSLSQLQLLPISELKLDRSFIQGLNYNSRKFSIVRAVIELGHHMGLKVVGEGIESIEDLQYLLQLECDQLQGYLFSKPLPADKFAQFTTSWDKRTIYAKIVKK